MCAPCRFRAGEGRFLLSDLLTAPGQALTLPLADAHGRVLPGCVAQLSAEELPNTNAVVSPASMQLALALTWCLICRSMCSARSSAWSAVLDHTVRPPAVLLV